MRRDNDRPDSSYRFRRPRFDGETKKTLEGSRPDWNQASHVAAARGRAERAARPDRRRRLRQSEHLRRSDQTPNYTRLAESGLRYNRFHVTALCSPTRAALLTGRNHHRVGFGMVGEFSGPFPGYNATIPRDCAPFPRILQENGYLTGGVREVASDPGQPAGVLGAVRPLADPARVRLLLGLPRRRGRAVRPADRREPEDHRRPRGQGRRAATTSRTTWPTRRSTGCTGSAPRSRRRRGSPTSRPAAATRRTTCRAEWSDKYRGKFDQGWDVMREETFARQKELGVVPADAELPPRNDAFPTWDSLDETHKRLYARQMEVYAGYSENADWNIGRIIDAIDADGRARQHRRDLDLGRQRREHGGTLTGTFNEMTTLNGIPLTPEQQMGLLFKHGGLEAWGDEQLAPHYSAGWAVGRQRTVRLGQAGRLASRRHAEPDGRALAGRHRRRGRDSEPLHARERRRRDRPRPRRDPDARHDRRRSSSSRSTASRSPTRSRTRRARAAHAAVLRDPRQPGMYRTAGCSPAAAADPVVRSTRRRSAASAPAGIRTTDPVELYYLPDDFTQSKNLAAEHPEKVQELTRALLGGGRGQPRPAAARRTDVLLRHGAADPEGVEVRLPRRHPEHPERDDPADLQPLVHDQRRPRSSPRAASRA